MILSSDNLLKLDQEKVELLISKNKEFNEYLYYNLKYYLHYHFLSSERFSFYPKSYERLYNWRQAFSVPYYLRGYVKNKHLCHIGSSWGDLELVFSKHAEKISMVEVSAHRFRVVNENLESGKYFCPIESVAKDFFAF